MWRINPTADIKPSFSSKYKFESRSCFLLDNIHYVHSKHSIFLQIFDVVIYSIMRVFTYLYLSVNPGIIEADIKKVPITVDTFKFFVEENTSFSYFSTTSEDVTFVSAEDLLHMVGPSDFVNPETFKQMLQKMIS